MIIKDVTNASNCAVVPNTAGNALGANTLVTAFNGALGLAGPVPVPGTNTTGAFSICDALAATIANPSAPLRGPVRDSDRAAALHRLARASRSTSAATSCRRRRTGNSRPGIQYTIRLGNGMTDRAPRRLHLYRQLLGAQLQQADRPDRRL